MDLAQQAAIDSKVAIATYESDKSSFDSTYASDKSSLLAADAAQNGKLAAIEEFIEVFLRTYTITLPSGNAYYYSGASQGLFA